MAESSSGVVARRGFLVVARTDTGMRRSRNEDNFFVLPGAGLCVVADGMGGHANGDVASTCAVETVRELASLIEAGIPLEVARPPLGDPTPEAILADTHEVLDAITAEDLQTVDPRPTAQVPLVRPDPDSPEGAEASRSMLRGMIDEANRRIYLQNGGSGMTAMGMGTTMVALQLAERTIVTACVGDSRIYRYRLGKLRQLTEDHSLIAELARMGRAHQAAALGINSNVITRALGLTDVVEPDLETFPHKRGDLYLLCSDGLTDLVSDEEIAALLAAAGGDLDVAADALVDAANERGGIDNITVVLAALESWRD